MKGRHFTAIKWVPTPHKGLRYYEHAIRLHGKKKDRYYSIRFKVDGKAYNYGVGWLSDGIPEEIQKEEPELGFQDYCLKLLRQYKGNVKAGSGPRSPKEARTIEQEKREQAEQERVQTEKESVTFGDFMTNTYLPQCKLDKNPRTYVNEEVLYRRHLAGTLADLPLSKITSFHLERVKKAMGDQKLSDRSVQYALQLLRQSFNTAAILGIYTGPSPTKTVRWPTPDNAKLRYLSVDEADTLLAALLAKSKNLHDAALLSLHCGLRFGEIAALKWSCWNRAAGTLAILNAKTGSRTAYLTERAKAMLKARKQGKPNELIFPKRSGKAGTMTQASKTFRDTVIELKFNEGIMDRKQMVTFHTLRHSFATHLYENTHDLYLTQRSLGHKTNVMTQRYAHLSENRLREGAAALEKAFKTNAKKGQVVNFKK